MSKFFQVNFAKLRNIGKLTNQGGSRKENAGKINNFEIMHCSWVIMTKWFIKKYLTKYGIFKKLLKICSLTYSQNR